MRGNDLESFCGTYGGYATHQKRGEPPCDECKRACTLYQRQRRAGHTPPRWIR